MSRRLDSLSRDYQVVTALQTSEPIGRGVKGTYIRSITLIPLALTVGAVTLQDGAETARTIFVGGTGVAGVNRELRPIPMPIGELSRDGAWKITTGADIIALVTYKS